MDDKYTTYIEFYSKRFPLCLTVAAQERANSEFGGIGKMLKDMQSAGDQVLTGTVELVHLLMCGGRDRAKALAWMSGEKVDVPEIPDRDQLKAIMTMQDVAECQKKIFEAIRLSSGRTVEVEPVKEKNVNTTQG